MSKYILRLDDAAPCANWENWERMELLLDQYGITPLVGVIPNCRDKQINRFEKREDFWELVQKWSEKGWTVAMHGYDHVYVTCEGGVNPVNLKSEFAGLSLNAQKEKIRKGIAIFRKYQIEPRVFFAPAHTFDQNTIQAIKEESNICIISDTVAYDRYYQDGITYVPQQSGQVRKLPFRCVTFCYHPNTCDDNSFKTLEKFLEKNKEKFVPFPTEPAKREKNVIDAFVSKLYFMRKYI